MAMKSNIRFKTIDEYQSAFPPKVRKLLIDLRKTIKQAVPGADELISYNMPAFKYHGVLVYYAAHTEHIGFYPGSSVVIEFFKKDLVKYKTSKGTVQFPFEKTIPVRLVKKLVLYKAKQNLERVKTKLKKKK